MILKHVHDVLQLKHHKNAPLLLPDVLLLLHLSPSSRLLRLLRILRPWKKILRPPTLSSFLSNSLQSRLETLTLCQLISGFNTVRTLGPTTHGLKWRSIDSFHFRLRKSYPCFVMLSSIWLPHLPHLPILQSHLQSHLPLPPTHLTPLFSPQQIFPPVLSSSHGKSLLRLGAIRIDNFSS